MDANLPNPGPQDRVHVPYRKVTRASTFVGPHPRHYRRSLHDSWWITGTEYHHDEHFHLVDNDFDPAPHHNDPAPNNDDNSPCYYCGGTPCWLWCPEGDSLPTGDREPDPRVLGSVRSRRGRVGDRDCMAREQLPTRRGEPHWLLLDLPDGTAIAQGHLRGGRVSRLVRSTLRRQGLDSGRSTAVCVLGLITLAALTLEVL